MSTDQEHLTKSLAGELETKLDQVKMEAYQADQSTEAKLSELSLLITLRRKDPAIEARYEQLRDDLALQLLQEGPRYYLDAKGHKRYAWAVQPEPIEINLEALRLLYSSGDITYAEYEQCAPRKPNTTAIRRLVANETISAEHLVEIATLTKGTAFIKVSDSLSDEDDED